MNSTYMESSSQRFAFITFRPHAGNPSALTDFLTIFLPKLSNCQYYAHCNEEVGTPNQHFHVLCSGSFKDKSKITQWIMTKAMKDFKASLKDSLTIWDHALDIKLIPPDIEEVWMTLGYVLKSENKDDKKLQKIKGFTNDEILQAVKMYFTTHKHKIKLQSQKDDYKILTSKNAHRIMIDYIRKNNKTVIDHNLLHEMRCNRHLFHDLSAKAQIEIIDTIKLSEEKELNLEVSEADKARMRYETERKLKNGSLDIEDYDSQFSFDQYSSQEHLSIVEDRLLETLERLRKYKT